MKSVKKLTKRKVVAINKRTFARECALETGLTQTQAYDVLSYLSNTIKSELLKGKEVSLPGIGKMYLVKRNTSKHYHPISKELYKSKEYKTIKIDIYPSFKEELNTQN